MTTFPALIASNSEANPPFEINLYASPEVRDRLFEQNQNLPGIRSTDLRLAELSDSELSQTRLLVPVAHSEFPTLLRAYLDEKVTRLRAVVEADVERALAGETSVAPDDMTWAVRFLIAEAAFMVGLNGNGRLVPNIFELGKIDEPHLTRLIQRTSALVSRNVMPILLRLTPRPPCIGGGDDGC